MKPMDDSTGVSRDNILLEIHNTDLLFAAALRSIGTTITKIQQRSSGKKYSSRHE
jgi:hypothetical protein